MEDSLRKPAPAKLLSFKQYFLMFELDKNLKIIEKTDMYEQTRWFETPNAIICPYCN